MSCAENSHNQFGRVQINSRTHPSVTACMKSTNVFSPSTSERVKTAMIDAVASCFALGVMAPRVCQSDMGGPSLGCMTSQLCSRSEERAKQKAASKRNGTVGRSGSAIPTKARLTQRSPKAIQTIRIQSSSSCAKTELSTNRPLRVALSRVSSTVTIPSS